MLTFDNMHKANCEKFRLHFIGKKKNPHIFLVSSLLICAKTLKIWDCCFNLFHMNPALAAEQEDVVSRCWDSPASTSESDWGAELNLKLLGCKTTSVNLPSQKHNTFSRPVVHTSTSP